MSQPASEAPERVLFIFLDGIGIGEDDPRVNPFAAASLPCLRHLLGGQLPLRSDLGPEGAIMAGDAVLVAADATLGMPGRPQSGTGQTALLTGLNAPALFGRHFGSWVPTPLRDSLASVNLLSRAVRAGRRAAFANAHPAVPPGSGVGRRPAAPSLAAHAAGLLDRGVEALREGRAIASSITNERWRIHVDGGVPEVSPETAGRTLAAITADSKLTLFAHYDTDLVGHHRDMVAAIGALERVDAFLGGLIQALPERTLMVIASDHGNLEDVRQGHTLNPVPVIASGPGSTVVARQVRAITDVTPALCDLLEIP